MTVFRKINDKICYCEGKLLILISLVLILSIMVQVVCRYVFKISTAWAEELARYMFCWLVPIGAGYCTARREHIEVGLINKFLDKTKNPERMHRIWFYIGRVCEAIFLILFGIIYAKYLLNTGRYPQYSTVLHINMMFIFASLMVGVVLMVVQGILLMLDAAFSPNKPIKEVGK